MKALSIFKNAIWVYLLSTTLAWAQEQFPWPVKPFNQSHEITGNFCEFRDTGSSDHFHNGTDIPKADGSPVYPVKSGKVTAMGSDWVRVEDKAYVHIVPASGLSVGDQVYASQTVIGTIEPGLGHVHFTNGYVGSERNSMLSGSGLTPLIDEWKPIIRFVKFFENASSVEYPASAIAGKVDIVVKVDEQNGPPSSPVSRRNNGTYRIGYKVLSADTQTVVFQPGNGPWRFQFDTKPNNRYVYNVFRKEFSSTTSHTYQVTNDISRDNYWNTGELDPGNYVVMVYTEDTRGNGDTMYVPVTVKELDRIPPHQPQWKFLTGTPDSLLLFWFANNDSDLLGYRVYFSFDNVRWSQYATETQVQATDSAFFIATRLNRDIYFRLSAVDDSPLTNESPFSSVYGMTNGPNIANQVLIVDGFDRRDGGWTESAHSFIVDYGQALWANQMGFASASHKAVREGMVQLENFSAVFWFTGDDNGPEPALDSVEQAIIRAYLEQGGQLFISGARIAYALDPEGYSGATVADETFLHEYLKVDFGGHHFGEHAVIGQTPPFDGLQVEYNVASYSADSTDILEIVDQNAQPIFTYSGIDVAGVLYEGTFGNSNVSGRMIYLAFPFETINTAEKRQMVMEKVLRVFFPATDIAESRSSVITQFELQPLYPNPFNPVTTIRYALPEVAYVEVAVFSIQGQRVRTLVQGRQNAGWHTLQWDGRSEAGLKLASGVYIVRMKAIPSVGQPLVKSQKVVLVK